MPPQKVACLNDVHDVLVCVTVVIDVLHTPYVMLFVTLVSIPVMQLVYVCVSKGYNMRWWRR